MKMTIDEIILNGRRSGLGGSDIPWVMGLVDNSHPYHKTAYEVYEEKVNGVCKDFSGNQAVEWGNRLEPIVAKAYEDMTGERLASTSRLEHKKYKFLFGTPDRVIYGKPKGVEIKTTDKSMAHLWGESGSQDVPEAYYLQIAHYMLVWDYEAWDLCVLIGGNDFRVYSFERDLEVDEWIVEKASKFWHDHVEKKIPPPIDFSDKAIQSLIRRKYTFVSDEVVNLREEYKEFADKIEDAEKNIKVYTKIKDENRAIILDEMGCAGRATLSDGRYFERVVMNRKGYTVEDSSYIKLNFKGR